MIIDHTNGRVLDVLEDRLMETVTTWLQKEKDNGLLSELEEVTMDMWDGYSTAVKTVFKNKVSVVIDLFHVVKNLQEKITKSRRIAQRELPKEEAKELKGSRWLWCKNSENLSDKEKDELIILKEKFPTISAIHDLRISFQEIFQDKANSTIEIGTQKLTEWIDKAKKSGLKHINDFIDTLNNWFSEIVNYFPNGSNNGRTEGYNRGLRTVLWRACGMRSFKNFRMRILHSFG